MKSRHDSNIELYRTMKPETKEYIREFLKDILISIKRPSILKSDLIDDEIEKALYELENECLTTNSFYLIYKILLQFSIVLGETDMMPFTKRMLAQQKRHDGFLKDFYYNTKPHA